ncbi:MAG: ATP-binding protein [Alphaproteobacteria bacterium]
MSLGSERIDAGHAAAPADERAAAQFDDRVRAELFRTLFSQVPAVLAASLAVCGLVTYLLWDSAPRGLLLGWTSFLVVSTLARFWFWYRTQAMADPPLDGRYGRLAMLGGAALGGVMWGSVTSYVISTSDSEWDIVVMGFVSGGMCAGAMAGLSGYRPMFYASALPNILPCALAYLLRDEPPYPVMGGLLLVFLPALAYFSRNLHRAMEKSATLRFENLDLIERLARAREAADALVVERTQALSRANRDLERRIRESARTEIALRETAGQLRLIADNLPVYVCLIGPDLRFRFANASYQSDFGGGAEAIVGRHLSEVLGEENFNAIRPYFDRALAGESVVYEVVRRMPNGLRNLRAMLVPHAGEDGAGNSVIGLIVDLTEERKREQALRKSEEEVRRIIQNMPVMMYALDRAGNIIVWNRECERITGFHAEQIVDKSEGFALLFPDPHHRQQMRHTVFAHADFRDWEGRVACADGSVKTISWFNISGSFPVPGWDSWGMGVDVSDRARARESLEEALDRERELNELKSRFVAMASHEFRTPLTSIQASVDMLRRYGERMSEEQKTENLEGIRREIGNLTRLLEGILTLERSDAGRMEFRPTLIDLRLICVDQVEKAKLSALPTHEFRLDIAGNCGALHLDEQLVLHLLTNMLSNAVKYSPEGGLITLALRGTEQEVRISVSDQGIGIPRAGREHLFDAFHRFRNVGAISGTGLGLAIMKRAAERHGGTIYVESEEGVGTTISVVLPIPKPEAVPLSPANDQPK